MCNSFKPVFIQNLSQLDPSDTHPFKDLSTNNLLVISDLLNRFLDKNLHYNTKYSIFDEY
jgi:hypothetical protein